MSRPHHLSINGQEYIIHPAVGAWLSGLCGYDGDVKAKLAHALGEDIVERFNRYENDCRLINKLQR